MSGPVVWHVSEGVAVLTLGPAAPGTLTPAVRAAVAAALADPGVHRVEVRLAADDRRGRRALHRSGFRYEGTRRAAWALPSGEWGDEALYALLALDVRHGPESFTAVMNAVLPRKRLIAHVLLTDEAGRVCVVETTFKDDWELPGGIVDEGESPVAGALRELDEELGVTVDLGGILVADWLRPHLGWEDALELIFAAPVVGEDLKARMRPDPFEIAAIHWLLPADAAVRLAPFARGRLEAALAATRDGRTRYLEGGSVVW